MKTKILRGRMAFLKLTFSRDAPTIFTPTDQSVRRIEGKVGASDRIRLPCDVAKLVRPPLAVLRRSNSRQGLNHLDSLATPDLPLPAEPVVVPTDARREEILDAATDLFAEFGYSDAVTKDLAERLQVGKGTIYRYFPSKRELFLAAADRVMRRLRVHIDSSIEQIADPIERISVGTRAFLEFFDIHPKFVELLILERALFKDRTTPTYFVHRERNKLRWHDLYRSLIAESVLRDMPVDRISTVFMDLAYGTIFTNHFSGRSRSVDDQTRDILDVMFHGILGESERSRKPSSGSDRNV
jgi:AcrR family transcriptional regulator